MSDTYENEPMETAEEHYCPFCGSGPKYALEKRSAAHRHGHGSPYRVRATCDNCGLKLAWYDSEKEALESWTRRGPGFSEGYDLGYEEARHDLYEEFRDKGLEGEAERKLARLEKALEWLVSSQWQIGTCISGIEGEGRIYFHLKDNLAVNLVHYKTPVEALLDLYEREGK